MRIFSPIHSTTEDCSRLKFSRSSSENSLRTRLTISSTKAAEKSLPRMMASIFERPPGAAASGGACGRPRSRLSRRFWISLRICCRDCSLRASARILRRASSGVSGRRGDAEAAAT